MTQGTWPPSAQPSQGRGPHPGLCAPSTVHGGGGDVGLERIPRAPFVQVLLLPEHFVPTSSMAPGNNLVRRHIFPTDRWEN